LSDLFEAPSSLPLLPVLPAVSDRLSLHAFLHRFCARRVSTLRDRLREGQWWDRAAELEREARDWLEEKDWAESCGRGFREAAARGEISLVVFCSAVLQALDAYHKERRLEVSRRTVEVPLPEGGKTAFLPPPEAPIANLVPDSRQLPRETGDLKNDLRTILRLWWHLVELEDLPVQPQFRLLPAPLSAELGKRLRTGDLLVALASPFGHLNYEAAGDTQRRHPGDRKIPYRFARLASGCLDEARIALDEIFFRCAAERVDLLCALGRLATPICLDFCGDELHSLLVDSGANLLLVPAMSQSMDLFHALAREFGTHTRATTFVVNSDWLLRQLGLVLPELRALAYVPAKGGLRTAGKLLSEELMLRVFSIRELVGLSEAAS